eukprot:61595_1
MSDEDIEMKRSPNVNLKFGMQIFVRIMSDRQYKTYPLIVNANALVQEIINKLSSRTGVHGDSITLSYRSRMLHGDQSLRKYNIQSESTINATARCQSNNNSNSKLSLSSAAFPPGHDLQDELHSVNGQIHRLKTRSIRRLQTVSSAPPPRGGSLSVFSKEWNDIQDSFGREHRRLTEKKLSLSNAINDMNKEHEHSIKLEIKLVQNEMATFDENVKEIDDKKRTYERLIAELNVQKAQQLSFKEAREQELTARRQSLLDFKTMQDDTAADIVSVKKELEQDSSVSLWECFNGMMKKYERRHEEWDTNDVTQWVRLIEHGKFNKEDLIECIVKMEIAGDSLKDLRNESFLKMLGLNAVERKCLFKNIDRVLNKPVAKSDICTVCVSNGIDSVFVPCGHQAICYECFQKEQNRFASCPICRKAVSNTVRTFMNGF